MPENDKDPVIEGAAILECWVGCISVVSVCRDLAAGEQDGAGCNEGNSVEELNQ